MNASATEHRRVFPRHLAPSGVALLGVAAALSWVRAADAGPRGRQARITPAYAEMVRRWHMPPVTPAVVTASGRPAFVLEILNTSERIELTPLTDEGEFSQEDIDRASHALRDPRSDDECTVNPRVLDLAYQVQTHFKAKAIRIVSAFRMPHGKSNHGKGRALDIVVPGTRDDELARFARTMGFVGVGLYPRSGFVHLDSRPRSFFWVDASGPGQRGRNVPVFAKLASTSDAKALARGESAPTDEPPEIDEEVTADDSPATRAR